MTKHLKRLFAPKTWKIKRKGIVYISKPSAGPHARDLCMPLNVILRDILKIATTTREVKYLLFNRQVMVDGVKKKDYRFPVGLFDVLSLPEVKQQYRITLADDGMLHAMPIKDKEASIKLCKIIGKTAVKGKVQLNLNDGRNMIVEKDSYKVGDGIVITIGEKCQIKDHIKLDKGALIFLMGGKHKGHIGTVEDIADKRIIYRTKDGNVSESLKHYAFPVGKEKPLIAIE